MRRSMIFALAASAGLAAAGAAYAIEPGQWQSTSQMTDISLPDSVPAQVADMMRRQMNERGMSSSTCITQEDIDEAPERIFEDSQGQCRYTEFNMEGGRLDAVAECVMDEGQMTMTMEGTYTDSTYAMTMVMEGDAGMGPMAMTSEVTGQRTGACT